MVAVVLWWLITLYVWVLLARVIVSWIPMFAPGWEPKGIVLVLVEFIYTLTDPPVRFLRRWIKPVQLGNASLDLSVLVLFIGLQLLGRLVLMYVPF
ncbi:YggT family protein [Tessaracoccus massiliensis]|uniref:YggT family protein n=1 Tax=Tessaracoccus massiliensis TaxID=1522311 RepID=UPI00058C4630|nr:YggT family protein [Tessaracoccus massiliensis]